VGAARVAGDDDSAVGGFSQPVSRESVDTRATARRPRELAVNIMGSTTASAADLERSQGRRSDNV
jgi:hypothetical protein